MPAEALPSQGRETARGCDTADLVMIHRFIRTMLAEASELVDAVADGDRKRAARLAEHVRQVALVLHNHHHGEDIFVWDDLEQRAPSCVLHVARMRMQHAEITELLAALEATLPPWAASGARGDASRVLDALARLRDNLDRHLGQEEDILPAAAVSFTQAEWDRLAEHGRATVPPKWALMQLGFMLETMPPADRAAFMRTIPAPVRLLWSALGRSVYLRGRARVYGPGTSSLTRHERTAA